MKTIALRTLVVALAVAGFSASAVASKAHTVKASVNTVPTPLCNPGNPACLDDGN